MLLIYRLPFRFAVAKQIVFAMLIVSAFNATGNSLFSAKKVFKTKCFATEQIKNLSAFFLKDASKYEFLDAAYLHVSDVQQFKTLQNLLTEEYYINRFKVMIH